MFLKSKFIVLVTKMFNFKERFKKIEFTHLLWNALGWFFLLFGLMDFFILHRLAGLPGIVAGVIVLIINFMKKNKYGLFKPKQKVPEKAQESQLDNKISVSQVITLIIMCAIGLTMIYYAWGWHQNIDQEMNQNCKHCSWGQKDCPYTDEELNEQEYGSGPCNDMGYYEMLWKFSFMVVLMGFMPIFISIAATVPWLRKKVFEK
jgi:magnesium-transporting ATPase (P-type)